jgi:VIT1/CCC1 family predicted Fe2+/Mn2+ transporter
MSAEPMNRETAAQQPDAKPHPVLDPIDRVSEIMFGVLMALTFTGTFSVAQAGGDSVRTLLSAALGCNVAWGLTDAVMYLVRSAIERRRRVSMLLHLRSRPPEEARRLIAEELPPRLADAGPAALEALRKRFAAMPVPPAAFTRRDYLGATGVFALVVLATFPVVVPFMLFDESRLALRVSNALALVTLFICGVILGRYAGGTPWKYGLTMTAVGIVLVAIIIALGG